MEPTKPKATNPFTIDRLPALRPLPDLKELFEQVLKKQKTPFAVVVELPYKGSAWDNRTLGFKLPDEPHLSTFAGHPSRPVGIVTKNVMEIYEDVVTHVPDRYKSKKSGQTREPKRRVRRKTTQILYPGMFCGLFEAYAELRGDWTIRSGVVSFLICNPIGDSAMWQRIGRWIDHENIQLDKRSNLTFDVLVADEACSAWTSESVWLKPALIEDEVLRLRVENLLRQATIRQLTSVIRQSPSWGRVGEEGAPDPELLWMHYLDSVISRDTPIFQLVDYNEEAHLPVGAILQTLSQYPKDANDPWDILLPRPLSEGGRGMYPVDYVSRFPPGSESCIVGRGDYAIRDLARKHNRQIKCVPSSAGFASVEYGDKAVVCVRYEPRKNEVANPRATMRHPVDWLAGDNLKRNYEWQRYFNTIVLIEKKG